MNSRERVLAALRHEEPDRVPYNLRPSSAMKRRLSEEQNKPGIDFSDFFRHDVRYATIPMPERPKDVPQTEWLPHPTEDDIAECARQAEALHDRGLAVCSSYFPGVYEHFKAWFGDVAALTMPYDDPDRMEVELDRITEWRIDIYGAYARAGMDIVWMGDDLGTQNSLVMSPDQYRQWYRPCHARIIECIRGIRPDVRIAFHCCGFVTTLIPDLIEIGVDILEAVQPECMDIAELKQEFGEYMGFWGGVGTQSALARTTPARVAEAVRNTLLVMAPGGGYIAAPCHTLTDEVPLENAIAFHEAVLRYGLYPVS